MGGVSWLPFPPPYSGTPGLTPSAAPLPPPPLLHPRQVRSRPGTRLLLPHIRNKAPPLILPPPAPHAATTATTFPPPHSRFPAAAAAALCLPPPWEPGTISPPPALCAGCLWNAVRWARPRRQDTAEAGDHYKNLLVRDAILSLSLGSVVGAVAVLGLGGGKLSRSPPGRQRRRHRRKRRAGRGGGEGGGEGTRKERLTGPGSPGRQQQPEPGETLRSRLFATVSER